MTTPKQSPKPADDVAAMVELVENAIKFSVWAAGEGLCPQAVDIDDPEEFLLQYSVMTGDEDWETAHERIVSMLTRQAEQIEALRAESDVSDALLADAKARAEAAEKRNAELEAVLEPFADIDGEGDEDFGDDTPAHVRFGRTDDFTLTLGDFRRARATYNGEAR